VFLKREKVIIREAGVRLSLWLLVSALCLIAGRHAGFDEYGVAGESRFGTLVMAPAVSDNLALLFEKFDTELVLCLEGEQRGADLHVTNFRMPHIYTSETGRVQAASCQPGLAVLGTWHNHPAAGSALGSSNTQELERNCYLSRTDIDDFRRRTDALIAVVSCGPRTYAYWGRGDVERVEDDAVTLPAVPGQLVRSERGPDDPERRLTQARER
jgi:hypothetical protein